MDIWLLPTHYKELEKSYSVKKFGRTLFFPKSIIKGLREYEFEHGSKGSSKHHFSIRCAFLMPEWYVKKYDILHWDNVHMKGGKTWEQHFKEKYDADWLLSPRKMEQKLNKNE